MRRLARGFCPKPGQLTLPSPSSRKLFVLGLEKFSLPSRSSTLSSVHNLALAAAPRSLGRLLLCTLSRRAWATRRAPHAGR